MEIFQVIKDKFLQLKINATKLYLIVANIILVVFAIWFSNVGLLPFSKVNDFAFFFLLALVLGLYRPGWTFAFFVGTLALENINLAPEVLGVALRPYQFFGFITIVALSVQWAAKRMAFPLPKWRWYDALPFVLALAGFFSSFDSLNKGISFKQSVVAVSFATLYYLTRIYIRSLKDLVRVTPFFLSSAAIVLFYGVWQNIRFLNGAMSFEVMPGRPNGTFTEPDWYGVYLVFLLSIIFAVIYYFAHRNKKPSVISHQKIEKDDHINYAMTGDQLLMTKDFAIHALIYIILTLTFVVLILTVSRSAWLGAAFVIVGFLKLTLIKGSWRMSEWQWKSFSLRGVFIAAALFVSLLISVTIPLTNFQIFNRAQSTGGLQKITISCDSNEKLNSQSIIANVSELTQYGCQHIKLEEIEKEKALGKNVFEISRPDPTVNIRAEIYKKSIEQIKENPIFGIGWGSISEILGKDESGAGLNASNIFLEVWLGSGLLGIISFSVLLLYVLIASSVRFMDKNIEDKTSAVFVILGWLAIVIPNLFNSGIFLGFVWVYLAVAISLSANKSKIANKLYNKIK